MSPEITFLVSLWDGASLRKFALQFEDVNKMPPDVRNYWLEPASLEYFRKKLGRSGVVVEVEMIAGVEEVKA